MASFDPEAELTHPADFAILRDGGLALYVDDQVLSAAEQAFTGLGYRLVRLEVAAGQEAFHQQIATCLDFPDHYGQNLNATLDCLRDVAAGDHGWDPAQETGLAVTVRGFGGLSRIDESFATAAAQIFAETSRTGLLFGHRIIWLLEVDDPRFRLGPVGGFRVPWNGAQWLDSSCTGS